MFYETFSIFAILFLCLCQQNPINEEPINIDSDIYVTGFLKKKNGDPVKGAEVFLSKSKISTITDSDGKYVLKGNVSNEFLSKRSSDEIEDTINIIVDSSQILNESITITSGVVFELPTTYIVQRNISGYLKPDDKEVVKDIIAVVYDTKVPEEKKFIKLWHDVVNETFNSFAYFYSDTGKEYGIYINVYDTLDRFIGRSQTLIFPDNAGDIEFTKPFSFNNAVPLIEFSTDQNYIYIGDTVKFNISMYDSFGSIVSYNIETNNVNETKTVNSENFKGIVDLIIDSLDYNIKVTCKDNDSNETVFEMNIDNILTKPEVPLLFKRKLSFVKFREVPDNNVTIMYITKIDTFFNRTIKYKFVEYMNDSLISISEFIPDSSKITEWGYKESDFDDKFYYEYNAEYDLKQEYDTLTLKTMCIVPKFDEFERQSNGELKVKYTETEFDTITNILKVK